MPLPDTHPLHEEPVETTTASVASGQTATVRAPYTGRITKVAAAPTTATTGGTATLTVTAVSAGGTPATVGVISIPISTVTDSSVGCTQAVAEGDLIVFTFSGSGTAGGVIGLTAYVRRGG